MFPSIPPKNTTQWRRFLRLLCNFLSSSMYDSLTLKCDCSYKNNIDAQCEVKWVETPKSYKKTLYELHKETVWSDTLTGQSRYKGTFEIANSSYNGMSSYISLDLSELMNRNKVEVKLFSDLGNKNIMIDVNKINLTCVNIDSLMSKII